MSAPLAHDDTASGRHIPLILLACLGVLIAVQACFVYLAVRSDPGVAAPNAYERGLAHNVVLREAADGAALGWHIAVEHRGAEAHRGTVVVTVRDAMGRPLDDLVVVALAVRPTRAGLDQHLDFRANGAGRYVTDYDLPLPGLWQLDLLLTRDGATLQRSLRFSAP